MAAEPTLFSPVYENSHAIIIGIDRYNKVSPLSQAANDAKGVATLLKARHGFLDDQVTLLIDADATRSAIMGTLLSLCNGDRVTSDDRVLVFFAGHGHTISGRRGEIGFLIPVDGDLTDLSTLIRWDELTRNADLIPAKHVFFIMDACYGGLALKRRLTPPGGMRLLNDMMQRYARQVLTAGKEDEPVSDAGGIRPGHSIFTSYLIEALEGGAEATAGVITASGVMAYVYDRVSNDPQSQQTPHFGTIDGDGDFIFAPFKMDADVAVGEVQFVQPAIIPRDDLDSSSERFADKFKRLLSSQSDKIALDALVNEALRRFIQETSAERFPREAGFSADEFLSRIARYEAATNDLLHAMILLGRWSEGDQRALVDKVLARAADSAGSQGGLVAWLNLAYYPVSLLMYGAGIGALYRQDFDLLRRVLVNPMSDRRGQSRAAVQTVFGQLGDLSDQFKLLPGFDRRFTPRSDYTYQVLQTAVEEELFVGSDYERLFDDFEVFVALTYANLRGSDDGRVWGPLGSFGWRGRDYGDSPLERLSASAEASGDAWPPIRAGMFPDKERVSKLITGFKSLIPNVFY